MLQSCPYFIQLYNSSCVYTIYGHQRPGKRRNCCLHVSVRKHHLGTTGVLVIGTDE